MEKSLRSVREQIVSELRSDILCSRIYPGVRLSEMELAERFGVRRGTVREALTRLVTEGLLLSKPNCGVTVAAPPTREVRELVIPIRRTVESFALKSYFAQLAEADFSEWEGIMQKMDKARKNHDHKELVALDLVFHRYLVARADQPELLGLWQAVVSQIRGHFGEKILKFSGNLEAVVEHHRKLIRIFRKGSCRSAIAELKRHIS
jgi:DNA-binding GntR family transcriptional regulator